MCPHMQIGCSTIRILAAMCWLKCHTIYYTFGMTNAWRTHRSSFRGEIGKKPKPKQKQTRRHGNDEAHNLACKSQKLVKNCSNFLLVKQTSQTNRPQLFVAAAKSAIPTGGDNISGLLSGRESGSQCSFPASCFLDKTHFDHCHGFWPSSCGGVNILWIYAGSSQVEGKQERRAEEPRLTFPSLWSALALGLCGLFWAKFAYNKPHQ